MYDVCIFINVGYLYLILGSIFFIQGLSALNTVKPVLSDHIKQDICLAFQTGLLLIAA